MAYYRKVSILVLMDAALRPMTWYERKQRVQGFNPCFNGCRPATGFAVEYEIVVIGVSILVLMDAALRPRLRASLYKLHIMFQSLFSWMPPCD